MVWCLKAAKPKIFPWYSAQAFLGVISEAAETAGRLVDALLNFSQMGRAALGL